MGFLSGLFGSPKKQKPTAAEKAQSQSSLRDLRRLETAFFPLQEKAAKESNKDFSGQIAGRSSADIAAQSAGANQSAVARAIGSGTSIDSAGALSRFSRLGDITGAAIGKSAVSSKTQAVGIKDQRKFAVTGLAYGLAGQTGVGLANAARNASSKAGSKLDARARVNSAVWGAIGNIAGAGAAKGLSSPSTPANLNAVTSASQLSIYNPLQDTNGVRAQQYRRNRFARVA